MNPYQPGEDNKDPYTVGYKAGAYSRDAEIAELKAWNSELVAHQDALADRCDKLIEQLASRDAEIAELKLQIEQTKLATPSLDAIGIVSPSPRSIMENYRNVLQARHEENTKELREQLAERDAEIAELRKFVQEQDELLQESKPIIKTAGDVRKERDQLREQAAECEAREARLRNLLRPFAALLQEHNCNGPDDQPMFQINGAKITRGDLRRALDATDFISTHTDT